MILSQVQVRYYPCSEHVIIGWSFLNRRSGTTFCDHESPFSCSGIDRGSPHSHQAKLAGSCGSISGAATLLPPRFLLWRDTHTLQSLMHKTLPSRPLHRSTKRCLRLPHSLTKMGLFTSSPSTRVEWRRRSPPSDSQNAMLIPFSSI